MSQALTQHVWWLASRASGVVALGLVTISVLLGLTMAGKLSRKPGAGRVLSAIHEQTAMTGLVAIAVHGLTLLGDPWLNPGPAGIAIPFTIAYKTFWVGLGITGGYLAALLGLSFYVRRRIGPRLWRRAHKATILVYALGVAHTLGAGTDASSPWLFWPVVASIPVVGGLFLARVVQGIRRGRARARSAPDRRDAARERGRELPPDVEIPPRHRQREIEEPAVA
ncbi:MAG: ferric reductase-like transmembrane domain-containing protein [Solirubrobacterales bacterium]